jgi:6 kDa early secretory antigenic target
VANLKVNFSTMGDGITALNKHWNQLQAHFSDLDSNVQQLMQVWDGGARAAYLAHQAKFRQASDRVHTSLKQMHGNLTTTSDGFRTTEKTITSGWS